MAADDEGPSLGGRLGRYARVGASVGGLAARLAGERYLGWTLDREKHAADLKHKKALARVAARAAKAKPKPAGGK